MRSPVRSAVALAGVLVVAAGCSNPEVAPHVETVTKTVEHQRPTPEIENPRSSTMDFLETLRDSDSVEDPLYESQLICQKLDQKVSPEGIQANLKTIIDFYGADDIENIDQEAQDLYDSAVHGLCPEHLPE